MVLGEQSNSAAIDETVDARAPDESVILGEGTLEPSHVEVVERAVHVELQTLRSRNGKPGSTPANLFEKRRLR